MFRKIAINSFVMTSVGVFRILAQILVIPVLSRFLEPHEYGLVAMAMPFILFTMIFTDAGLGQSLVRSVDKERDVWSTAFWITLILGGCLGGLITLTGPFAAMFFAEPRLQSIIFALSIVVIFQAGATIPEAALRQQNRFAVIALTEMAAIGASLICAIILAMTGFGVWALVVQQLVLYGGRFILTFLYSPFRPALLFFPKRITEHLIFGRDVLAAGLIGFITQSADAFIIGKVLGAAILGVYSMAFLFLRLPGRILMGPIQYVVYTHLAPLCKNTVLIKGMYLALTRILGLIIIPPMFMIGVAHGPFFEVLLSAKWAVAGQMFMMAAPAAALQAVGALRGTFVMIIGRTDLQVRMNAEFCLLVVVSLLVMVPYGVVSAVMAYVLAVVTFFFRGAAITLPRLACTFSEYAETMTVTWITALVAAGTYIYMAPMFGEAPFALLGLAMGLGFAGLLIGAGLQFKAICREFGQLRILMEPA